MGDLGDLSGFLKEGGVANLDWLDVDENQYRENDTLPKQNLDIQPDLEALWARDDSSATTHLVPNVVPVPPFQGAGQVHTMGDLSRAHGRLSTRAEEIRKVARLALMQSVDPNRLRDVLVKRFGLEPLQEHRTVLAEVLQERGLLGKLYIDASDFPGCQTGKSEVAQFVRRYAGEARFVVAKHACNECRYAATSPMGGTNCAVFHKELELAVPYSSALAEAVENSQAAKGKDVQASNSLPIERIRLAFLAKDKSLTSANGAYAGQGLGKIPSVPQLAPGMAREQLVQVSDLVRAKRVETQEALYAKPVVDFLRREMVKGLSPEDLTKSLRLAFNLDDLRDTRSHWEPLFKEAGLFGVVYSTQESFADCREGADFFAKHNPGVRSIVAGTKCGSCIYNKTRCLMYGKPLIREAAELYTPETVQAVLLEHRTAGRLQPWDTKTAMSWGSEPREQLKSIHRATSRAQMPLPSSPARMDVMKAFYGDTPSHVTAGMTKREILKQAAKYLNEGLYGSDLLRLLKARFDPRDLVAASHELKRVIAEQGLQGIYYVDPTAYDDYGRGCDEAARLHRTRLVPYVKLADKCSSCVLQTKLGFCSKLHKPLVHEPPYVDKMAQQRAILTAELSTDVGLDTLVNSGASMMAEYQMQNGGMDVEVNAATPVQAYQVEFNNHKIGL